MWSNTLLYAGYLFMNKPNAIESKRKSYPPTPTALMHWLVFSSRTLERVGTCEGI